ncbi:phospholipid carrier-dependent glycosyltransferase [Sphingomonas sp. CJ99]
MTASFARRPIATALLIAVAAQLLFSVGVTSPSGIYFDETHYVPAARALIDLSHRANPEHPLLGKLLIALGMTVAGDGPLGWRIASTLAGTGTVLGVYWALWLITRRVGTAALGAALTAMNGLVFIHARIGMLEPFLALFLVLALVAMVRIRDRMTPARLAAAGMLLGLATAVKWAAAPYVALACLVLIVLGWRRGGLRQALGAPLLTGLCALGTYFLTFLPAAWLTNEPVPLASIGWFQFEMLRLQTMKLPAHPYQSQWWQWPAMLRPIWYFYEPDQGVQRGVLLIGNPAVLWGGLVAVAACIRLGLRRGGGWMLAMALLWVFSLGVWIVIPKSLGFFYYYQMSAIWLCLCLALALDRVAVRWRWAALGLAAALFAWFYPIIAARPLPDAQAFSRWMWLDSWR